MNQYTDTYRVNQHKDEIYIDNELLYKVSILICDSYDDRSVMNQGGCSKYDNTSVKYQQGSTVDEKCWQEEYAIDINDYCKRSTTQEEKLPYSDVAPEYWKRKYKHNEDHWEWTRSIDTLICAVYDRCTSATKEVIIRIVNSTTVYDVDVYGIIIYD